MSLRVEVAWDRPASAGDSEHWLSVTFSGLPAQDAPASIAVLVDTSTSMVGERLAQARSAVAALVRGCRTRDRIAVFSFASEARKVVEASGGDDVTAVLGTLDAGGKTRLDLALAVAGAWLEARAGLRHLVLLTDGDPTDADGRRVPVEALVEGAGAFGRSGIRTAVVGLGSADGYDAGFLRSFADAAGGTAFVGVPIGQIVGRTLAALRSGTSGQADLQVRLDSEELTLLEAWRVAPHVQPLPIGDGALSLAALDTGGVILHVRLVTGLAAGRGPRTVGLLNTKTSDGSKVSSPLVLNIVNPNSLDRNAIDVNVDKLRVRVELARTAQLRAGTADHEDQLRMTQRLADLVEKVGDPRATARISDELRVLATGRTLDRDTQERTVDALRGGRDEA